MVIAIALTVWAVAGQQELKTYDLHLKANFYERYDRLDTVNETDSTWNIWRVVVIGVKGASGEATVYNVAIIPRFVPAWWIKFIIFIKY